MATYMGTIYFSNRRRLSIYFASTVAVGVRLPVDLNAAATTTSPTDFRVPEALNAVDFITTNTAGEFERA